MSVGVIASIILPPVRLARTRVCVCVCVSVDKKSVLPDYIIVEEGERGRGGPMNEKGGREIPLTAMVARMEEGYRPEATESLYREVLGEKRQGISREARVSRISGS